MEFLETSLLGVGLSVSVPRCWLPWLFVKTAHLNVLTKKLVSEYIGCKKTPSYYSKESVAYAHIIRNLPFRGLLISTQSSMRMAFPSIFTTSTWLLQKQFFVTPLRFHLELRLWRCTITTPVWNIFQKIHFLLFPCWLCVNYSYYSLSNTRSKKSFAFDMKTTEWFNPASHQVCVSHEFLLWSLKKLYFLWADSPKC